MADLIEQIKDWKGKILIVGLGSVGNGDDAVGLYIAKRIATEKLAENVRVAVCESEKDLLKLLGTLGVDSCDSADFVPSHVIFLDAVEFGGRAGEIVLLESEEIKSRFPQVSTHKISLSAIAKYIEGYSKARVWLIGIQVKNVGLALELSPEVRDAANALIGLLTKQPEVITEKLSGVRVNDYV